MRAGGLACALLLLASGASNALPQYGGGSSQQQQEEQVGQQQEGGFWWKDKGVFEGQSHVGSQVHSGAPGAGGFTPTQSQECALQQGCVPWQYCHEGSYRYNPDVNLNVRSPTKVPDHITHKLCGQIGNICCQIPDEILQQQQQAQGGVPGIPGIPGAPGAVPHSDVGQVTSGGGYGGSGGIISGSVTGGVEETSEGLSSICPQGHDCVPHFQCNPNGTINDSGVGLIDIRFGPRPCSNPEYPEVPALCCKIPGASQPQVLVCPAHQECVEQGQCKPDGTINTDGSGLIDKRIITYCHLDTVSYNKGICCNPPKPDPVATCPGDLVCRVDDLCVSPAPVHADGSYAECYVNDGSGAIGVCCEPPAPLEVCPGSLQCKIEGVCGSPGAVNADGSYTTCYVGGAGEVGICCEPPAPLIACPGDLKCALEGECGAPGAINADGSYTTCYVGGAGEVGICCEPPAPLTACPGDLKCRLEGECGAPGAINADGSYTSCYVGGAGEVGICCEPPAPLQTCPGDLVCKTQGHCTSPGALQSDGSYTECYLGGGTGVGICCQPVDTCPGALVCADQCSVASAANADGSYEACYKSDGSGVGACCEHVPVVDVCPADSVCLPDVLCDGEFLNAENAFVAYGKGVKWMQCPLSGDASTPGVCCKNKARQTYPTANACGVRNYALDTRISNPLAINEASFGEFPWQAIIFFTNYTYKCGASIISENHILTGAHCVYGLAPGDIQVRVGEWQVNSYHEPLKYADYPVSAIAAHPDFNNNNLHNDIAILTLTNPIAFNYHINSVCVPDGTQSFSGARCFATGWGKDSFEGNYQVILKHVDLPLVDHYSCQEKLRKTRLGKYFRLHDSFICAGGEEGKDACTGDGGGPLVCKDSNTGSYFVKGITAWGIGCGEKDVPGVYADVEVLLPWMQSVLSPLDQQQQGSLGGYGK